MNMTLEFILLIILLFLAAVTAASEIAIIAMSRIKLRRLAAGGSKTAKLIIKILEMPERFFGTILVVNDIVDALIAVLVTALIIRYIGGGGAGLLIATLAAAFLIIISEVTAKALAARHSERMSLVLARPIKNLIVLFSPLVKILEAIVKWLVEIIGGKTEARPSLVTEEEIRALIKMGEEGEGGLHKEKYRMLSKIFDFSETVAKDVMTPKNDIVTIDIESSLDDIVEKILESGYSRMPVCKGGVDNIIGIMNTKDILILSHNKDLVVIQDLVYPAKFVPHSKKVTELLKEFQKGHTHLALVVDESQKVFGLVTLEDLLEEIVGEIEDEYDIRANPYKTMR